MPNITGSSEQESTDVARAMEAFSETTDYPLAVVTVAGVDGSIGGCLAGFFTQCSIEPPRFLVCLSKVNHTFFVSEDAVGLALHLIGQDQIPLASLFAEETGDTTDKFALCEWHPGVTGAPVLDECAAWVEGPVLDRLSAGDHEALLMRPVAGGAGPGHGLLTFGNSPDFRPGHPSPPS